MINKIKDYIQEEEENYCKYYEELKNSNYMFQRIIEHLQFFNSIKSGIFKVHNSEGVNFIVYKEDQSNEILRFVFIYENGKFEDIILDQYTIRNDNIKKIYSELVVKTVVLSSFDDINKFLESIYKNKFFNGVGSDNSYIQFITDININYDGLAISDIVFNNKKNNLTITRHNNVIKNLDYFNLITETNKELADFVIKLNINQILEIIK